MIVIAMSDLHIGKDSPNEEMLERIYNMRSVVGKVSLDEEVLLVFCGDFFHLGSFNGKVLEKASIVMNEFSKVFPGSQYRLIPGNHDIRGTSLDEFDEFAKKYQGSCIELSKNCVYSEVVDNVNFIFANSCAKEGEGFSHQGSRLDANALRRHINAERKNVLVMHHSFFNDGKLDSPIEAQSILNSDVDYIINGHRHASMNLTVEADGQKIFSLGKLFSFNTGGNYDSPSQFTVFKTCAGDITTAWECKYDGDKKTYQYEKVYGEDYTDVELYKSEMPVVLGHKSRYINRTVSTREFEMFSRDKNQLVDTLLKEKRIILLADAGVGKTTELVQLRNTLFRKRGYYPIYIKLSQYTNKRLEDYIPDSLRKSNAIFAFVLDGYDELQLKDKNDFKRKVDEYVESDARALVLISSRRNFYYNTIGEQNSFPKFTRLFLNPVSKCDVDGILAEERLDVKRFYEIVYQKGLTGMIYNPFYLFYIVEEFKKKHDLTQKNGIVGDIITQCFREDIVKYGNTEDLASNRYRLNNLLEKCAFAIQINQRQILTDEEYQALFSDEERELLKYSGVWRYEEEEWKFLHNIFREFLTARALESMPLDKIEEIIAQQDTENTYWQETLSFLVSSSSCRQETIQWVKESHKHAIIAAESLTIAENERREILENILEEVESRCFWLGQTSYKAENLARFACCEAGLEYLIKKIKWCKRQGKSTMLCNVLDILGCFRNYEDIPKTLVKVLLELLDDNRFYVNARSIKAISNLKLHCEEITNKILQNFGANANEYVLEAIGEYFIESKLCEKNIEYLLEVSKQERRTLRMHYNILEALKTIDSCAGIIKIIDFFAKYSKKELSSQDEEFLREVYSKAAGLYNKRECQREIFETIDIALMRANDGFSSSRLKIIKQFIKGTNTNLKFFLAMLEKDKECKKYYTWEEVIDRECAVKAMELYEKGELPSQAFQSMTFCMMRQKNNIATDMQKALMAREGIDLAPIDYEKRQRREDEAQQKYFDLLFDREAYLESVKELIRTSGTPDITFGALAKMYGHFKEHPLLQMIRSDIMGFPKNERVEAFGNKLNWSYFSAHHIYEMLKPQNSKINVTEEKINWLRQYCKDVFARKIITKDKKVHFTWEHAFALLFSSRFNFEIEQDVLLDFLVVDNNFFKQGWGSPFLPIRIIDHVPKALVDERILYNLREVALDEHIKAHYFDYLKEQEISDALSEAEAVLMNTEDEYLWQKALAYILHFKTCKYVDEIELSILDEAKIRTIVTLLNGEASTRLDEELIRRYDESKNMDILGYLIRRNSLYGLKRYYEMAKERNTLPDNNGDEECHHFLTDALRDVDDFKCFRGMLELFELSHNDSFEDVAFGLKGAAFEILQQMATQNYVEVRNGVFDLIKEDVGEELCRACNVLLKNIDQARNNSIRKKWTAKEIEDLCADVF